MLTPQEVASHAFSKAALGGYNMAMVDQFLDELTEDYTALYNDNAILKNKLKVLSDTVEEYRATDEIMRKTLLNAQQMADAIVSDAKKEKAAILEEAESAARSHLEGIRGQVAEEELRLRRARQATDAYVKQVRDAQAELQDGLEHLAELTMDTPRMEDEAHPDENRQDRAEPELEEDLARVSAQAMRDLEPTRRFDQLQAGRDYEIR